MQIKWLLLGCLICLNLNSVLSTNLSNQSSVHHPVSNMPTNAQTFYQNKLAPPRYANLSMQILLVLKSAICKIMLTSNLQRSMMLLLLLLLGFLLFLYHRIRIVSVSDRQLPDSFWCVRAWHTDIENIKKAIIQEKHDMCVKHSRASTLSRQRSIESTPAALLYITLWLGWAIVGNHQTLTNSVSNIVLDNQSEAEVSASCNEGEQGTVLL